MLGNPEMEKYAAQLPVTAGEPTNQGSPRRCVWRPAWRPASGDGGLKQTTIERPPDDQRNAI
jgi:hypothetical protein